MILVTTPNGKVGREVSRALFAEGADARLGAHTPEKAERAFPDMDVVSFDFGSEDSVRAALEGVSALYLASPGGIPAEPVTRVVDIATEMGVARIVRLSALGVEQSDNPMRQIEQHIEASGLTWTHLRPTWFMQNYSTIHAPSIREDGAFYEPAGDAKTSFIDTRDIAAVAVRALLKDGHHGEAYALTGAQAHDRHEVAAAIANATGNEVRYEPISSEQFREQAKAQGMPEHYAAMMSGLYEAVRAGHTAEVTDTVQQVLERAPTSLETFAHDYREAWVPR